MCGIAGGTFAYPDEVPPVEREEQLRICERRVNWGPDDAEFWLSEEQLNGLSHRRLPIIDHSRVCAQRIQDANASNQIVVNGEIINYRALRRELEASDPFLHANLVTEVLLNTVAVVRKLRGIYALACWDSTGEAPASPATPSA